MPGRRCVALSLMLLVAATSPARPQGSASRREAVTLPVSANATRRLASAVELIASSQWEAALGALADLEGRQAGELVEVAPRRVLSAQLAVQLIRSQLPDEALAGLRRTIDGPALESLNAARAAGDEMLLARIVAQSLASSSGDDAVAALADLAWERGEFDRAAGLWSLLEPASSAVGRVVDPSVRFRIPTDAIAASDLAARQVLVSLFEQDRVRAAERLRDFETRFPEAVGRLAGREGRLLDTLRAVERESAAWPRPSGSRWEINGGPSRNAVAAADAAPGAAVWNAELAPPSGFYGLTRTPLLRAGEDLASVPAIDGSRVFVQDAQRIRALRVSDGSPLWPTGSPDDVGTIFGGLPGESGPAPALPFVGHLAFAPSVDDGRLFALVGWPVSVVGAREPRPLESRLVCLDVDRREGKLLWSRTPGETLPAGEWRFSGPPLATEGRVFVAARKGRPEMAVGVACLDAASGETVWFQTVCGLLDQAPETFHLVASDVLTAAPDRILLASDFGVAACLDSATGRVQWIVLDDPLPWTGDRVRPEPEAPLRPAITHRGQVYSVQHDDRTIQALDLVTGAALWRATLPSRVGQLVGVRGGLLIASGDQLWGLDMDTGSVRWRFGFDDVEGVAFGNALVAGRSILWPTREELFEIDLETGLPVRRVPWAANGDAAGHLGYAGDRLLIAGPRRLTADRTRTP